MRKTKLKYHFKFGMGETILREEVSDNPEDGYPVYSATEDDKVFGYKRDIKRILDVNDIIIAARGTIGSVNIIKEKSGCTQTTMYMKNLGDFNSDYVYYYLQGHRDTMFSYDKTAIPQLTISKFSNEYIMLPSMEKQDTIVSFLDERTGKIDSLIGELTKFKTTLQLQKRSLISECVTKGLPDERDREYKDSGVEWLGEVPTSWEINKVGSLCEAINGHAFKPLDLEGSTTPVIRIRQLMDETVDVDLTDKIIDEKFVLSDGDIVFAWSASLAVKVWNRGKAYLNQHLFKIVPDYNKVEKSFLYYLLSAGIREYDTMSHGATMQHLTRGMFEGLKVTLPPLYEQQRIADYLNTECAKIDSLMAEIDNQVDLLKTYRKSLINEVVTGKVEV